MSVGVADVMPRNCVFGSLLSHNFLAPRDRTFLTVSATGTFQRVDLRANGISIHMREAMIMCAVVSVKSYSIDVKDL